MSAYKMYSVNSFKLFTQISAPACWNLRATDCLNDLFPISNFGTHHKKSPLANYLQLHLLSTLRHFPFLDIWDRISDFDYFINRLVLKYCMFYGSYKETVDHTLRRLQSCHEVWWIPFFCGFCYDCHHRSIKSIRGTNIDPSVSQPFDRFQCVGFQVECLTKSLNR